MITQYNNVTKVEGFDVPLLSFLNQIKSGTWKQLATIIKNIKDDKERRQTKEDILPGVTISGTFFKRNTAGLKQHSGFICIDIDKLGSELEDVAAKLRSDKYTFSLFKSVSGNGLAVLVKIDPKRHLDAYLGLERYYAETYGCFTDPQCKDVTRFRYVSYDPDLYINQESEKFTIYLKRKRIEKIPNYVVAESDISHVINQLCEKRIDITQDDYARYLRIGFGIASKYGESGREYFHAVCQFGPRYDRQKADKQFSHCLKPSNGTKSATIATFLHYAKEAGIRIVSEQTRQISMVAMGAKRGARTRESAIKYLQEIEGVAPETSKPIVDQVFDTHAEIMADVTLVEELQTYMTMNYGLRRNMVTEKIESDGIEIDDYFINDVLLRSKIEVNEKINKDLITTLLFSSFSRPYHPLREWFEARKGMNPIGVIDALASTVDTDTGLKKEAFFPLYKNYFIRKWLVGLVASAYGYHSPLLLVFTGAQNSGKTEWFRRMLPHDMKRYFVQSKLDAGKDDEKLMCTSWIIFDDEFGGKSKQDSKRIKELTSRDEFTMRDPYGRVAVTRKRLAVLCGTSNEETVLNDPTGNRRIIPINVKSIDFEAYNAIDKEALLMEAYHLYVNGESWHMTKEDIQKLNGNTIEFEQVITERELMMQYYKPGHNAAAHEEVKYLTATQIMIKLTDNNKLKIYANKLGQELKTMGFKQISKKINGIPTKVYPVIEISPDFKPDEGEEPKKEQQSEGDLPF